MTWLLLHRQIWPRTERPIPTLVNMDHVRKITYGPDGPVLHFAPDCGHQEDIHVAESFEDLQELLASDLKRARSAMTREQLLDALRLPADIAEEMS